MERSLNNSYWKALSFLPRKIDELYRLGELEFFARVNDLNQHPSFYSNEIKSVPSNRIAIRKLIKFKWMKDSKYIEKFILF